MKTTDFEIEMRNIREENEIRSKHMIEILNCTSNELAETILISKLRKSGIKVILSDNIEVLYNDRVLTITKNPVLTLHINNINHRIGLKAILNYFEV